MEAPGLKALRSREVAAKKGVSVQRGQYLPTLSFSTGWGGNTNALTDDGVVLNRATNSFLNGVQIAEALLITGHHHVALVASGEIPSRSIRWQAAGRDELITNLPGYTMGDAGGAAVLERATDGSGIVFRRFLAASHFWPAATIPGGGTRHPRGEEYTYIRGNGGSLKEAFVTLGPRALAMVMASSRPGNARIKSISHISSMSVWPPT